MSLTPQAKLEMKELELKSLFETIRAINSNASEKDLYKIYKFILRAKPNITKLALFVYDESWECKAYFGTKKNYKDLTLDGKLLELTEISPVPFEATTFDEFNTVIPVKHKDQVLAYVLLGGASNQRDAYELEIEFVDALSNIIIVAIENKKLARKELRQRDYNKQLEIARNVQTLLFPKKLPYDHNLKVAASYLPHHTIGGDYYDFLDAGEGRYLMCIADVSGKGIPAAILMSNFQAALRILTRNGTPLDAIVNELNYLIFQNAQGENFITAFFALFDFNKRSLTFVNAGHNPPFLFINEHQQRLETGTTILGTFRELPFLEIGHIEDLKRFFVFCFTDGFTETYNEKGEEFGDEYLNKFLEEYKGEDQVELHERLISLLDTFKGDNAYADDITLLSCRVNFE
ncbi:PP2C family protein-serine/threonine phosphatase [Rapidithrix thailandica]|uniref:PP2C family protein-serine/threonine phosphatase n=2 Tax=Rapidithrix thailandica TaxID=413964 RepID=A0AAW9RPP0_9BACT